MDHYIDYLAAFTASVKARLPYGIRRSVRKAHLAGVSRQDLLDALETAEKSFEIPPWLLAFAIVSIWSVTSEDRVCAPSAT